MFKKITYTFRNTHDLCLARNKFTRGMMVIAKCNEMDMMGKESMEYM